MKFAEHLGAHITPEWRKQYIQYEEMKAQLFEALENAPAPEGVEADVVERYLANFEEKFFAFCEKELTKIDTFYTEKLSEATRKFATLKSELEASTEQHQHSDRRLFGFGRRSSVAGGGAGAESATVYKARLPARKLQDLKLAFSEYYLSLVLLQNYQNLNFTGFRKILKKYDKNLQTENGARWRREHVDVSNFYANKGIDKLIQETERSFIQELEGGDRQKAMKRLRVPPLGDQQSPWTTFKVGFFSGAFLILLVTVVLSAVFYDHDYGELQRNDWRVVFRLYRGPLLVILFVFLIGNNVYGWRSSGVNHVLIFELDPRNHLSEQHLMELASILGVIWTLSVLTFLYSSYLAIPAYVNPLALTLIMAAFMLNPTKTLRYEARFWILRVLGRILCAPFFPVGFPDFWIADQLNSLAPALVDMHYLVCFYTSKGTTVDNEWEIAVDGDRCTDPRVDWIRPLVLCLPAWFRFAQCLRRYRDSREAFPHLVNAGKYSTTFFVVLFSSLNASYSAAAATASSSPSSVLAGDDDYDGDYDDDDDDRPGPNPFFYLWILCAVVSSLYAYTWDIKMDWGLMDGNKENRLLREEMVYDNRGYYYFAMVEDLVLRFAWAISLTLKRTAGVDGDLLTSVLAPLEVFRRFVWNFIRLENEHLNNCGNFRAVRDISIAPLEASDQALIIRMMDEEDGVMVVRKRKTAAAAAAAKAAKAAVAANAAQSAAADKKKKTGDDDGELVQIDLKRL